MIEAIFFYTFSTVLLLSAGMVITARNPVHAVLFLILTFFNAAGLFIMLGAEFIAMILVIVYVGAVAVLFLFVVMMLDIDFAELRRGMRKHAPIGALVGATMLGELIWLFGNWSRQEGAAQPPVNVDAAAAQLTNTEALGRILYTQYALIFQLSGMILLVAMIGAITLTLRKRVGTRRQSIHQQVNRHPKDVLRIEKIGTGEGISS